MRRLAGIGVVLTIGMLATAAFAQPSAIVPGQSLGEFRLGQDVAPVLDALGPLHSQDDLPGNALTGYYWPLRHLGIIADKPSRKVVALVVSLDDTYRTDKGVAAGTEMDAVRAAYGREDGVEDHPEDQLLIYDRLGVAFVVDRTGPLGSRVSAIFVFAPGHYHDIFQP